ncbi:M10 family metallopeptidase [Rhodoligotrophos ferricapiens]|uniref:M10 family metallopeptidase n=1 Tax=Rhodoligotrophos ferricapiens TaxID=3069264 RepID=UPI00315CB1A4
MFEFSKHAKIGGIRPSHQANINALLGDFRWTSSAITFSFPAENEFSRPGLLVPVNQIPQEDGEDENVGSYVPMPEEVREAIRHALRQVSDVARLQFSEVTQSPETADIRFALKSGMEDGYGGLTSSYPWAPAPQDVVINSRLCEEGIKPGSMLYHIVLHEIGHALGLEHGHGDSGYSVLTPDHDGPLFSLMTYNGDDETGVRPQSFSQFDIAALQHLYGPNYGTRNTDTVYTFSPTTGQMFINGVGQGAPAHPAPWLTIWDGGGRDRYDFSNMHEPVTVDLRPGKASFIAPARATQEPEGVHPRGVILNALLYNGDPRALIEDATGGAGDDRIHGNEAANHIRGRDGDDVLSGDAGDDKIEGDDGDDTLYGNDGDDELHGGEGKDQLFGGAGDDRLFGESGNDRLDGGTGENWLFGGDGNDVLIAGPGRHWLHGGSGRDTFTLTTPEASVTIVDFTPRTRSACHDVIDLSPLGVTKNDAESVLATARQTDWGTALTLSGEATICLPGLMPAELTLADIQYLMVA